MSDFLSGSTRLHDLISVEVDPRGIVRLSWAAGLHITERLARHAMARVDEANADRERPLLVTMAASGMLARDARIAFTRKCTASRIALLGRSPVDRVIAHFAIGVNSTPVPTRYFTSEPAAVAWLCDGDTDA